MNTSNRGLRNQMGTRTVSRRAALMGLGGAGVTALVAGLTRGSATP